MTEIITKCQYQIITHATQFINNGSTDPGCKTEPRRELRMYPLPFHGHPSAPFSWSEGMPDLQI